MEDEDSREGLSTIKVTLSFHLKHSIVFSTIFFVEKFIEEMCAIVCCFCFNEACVRRKKYALGMLANNCCCLGLYVVDFYDRGVYFFAFLCFAFFSLVFTIIAH
jgi:hypothetical protein